MIPPSFHVAGDALNTDVNEIADALSKLPLRIRTKSPDELRIYADNLSFEIYAHQPGEERGQDFLISGEVEGRRRGKRGEVAGSNHRQLSGRLRHRVQFRIAVNLRF